MTAPAPVRPDPWAPAAARSTKGPAPQRSGRSRVGPYRQVRAVALAGAATLAVMATLGAVVTGPGWATPTIVAVVATSALGMLAAAGRVPGVGLVLLTAAGGLVFATALHAPDTAIAGVLPTPTTLVQLSGLLQQATLDTRTVAAPAPVTPSLQALLTVSMLTVLVSVVALAAWLRQPGLAGLPLLLVACVPAALAPAGIGSRGFLLAAGGYVALTLTDADQRIRAWGPVLRRRSSRGRPQNGHIARSFVPQAAVVTVLALAVATFVPALLPGLRPDSLTGRVRDAFGEGGLREVQTINPIIDLREDLRSPQDTQVLRYTSDDPSPDPLRIVTADEFDGTTWKPSSPKLPADNTVDRGMPVPPGLADDLRQASPTYTTTISVTGLEQQYLPLPYPAVTVDVAGRWLYDPATLNVVSAEGSTLDLTYTVTSLDVLPDPARLAAAPAAPAEVVEAYTGVPEGLPEVVGRTAQEVTAEAGNDFDRALALQDFFRDETLFRYSLDAPDSSGSDAIAAFLEERSGYCVQFASAMAVMARTLGIPARVGIGFLPGSGDAQAGYRVSLRDAHAWPELYFADAGWVRFEPTPAARTGDAPDWTRQGESAQSEPQGAPSAAPEPSAAPSAAAPEPSPSPSSQAEEQARAATQDGDRVPLRPPLWLWLPLALAGLLALPALVRAIRVRIRWARTVDDPAAAARAAWQTLGEGLADLGWRVGTATVRQEATRLATASEPGAAGLAALHRIVEAVERATFAATPAAAGSLPADVLLVVAEYAATVPRLRRWRARVLPSPWATAPPASRRGTPEAALTGVRRDET